jgi:hypothetical protein
VLELLRNAATGGQLGEMKSVASECQFRHKRRPCAASDRQNLTSI